MTEQEKCENCGKIITPEMKASQEVIYADAEHTLSSEAPEIGEEEIEEVKMSSLFPYRDLMFSGVFCCKKCYEEISGIELARRLERERILKIIDSYILTYPNGQKQPQCETLWEIKQKIQNLR